MATRHKLNTDHWSKMRMNMIKNAINTEQRGRVLTWEKHQKAAVQRELEAAIHDGRSLPKNKVGITQNFQDVLTEELEEYIPGSAYLRRQVNRNTKSTHCHQRLTTSSQYTLMTLPTNPQSDQTRSRVPVLQCRGKI